MTKLSPSILAADPMYLGDAAKMMVAHGCDEVHFDVMDSHFVPNITFGPHILGGMKKLEPRIVYDVHLMLSEPLVMIDSYAKNGADIITVHQEANGFEEAMKRVLSHGIQLGVSLRPRTSVDTLRPYLSQIDRVLLMTVEPGFGGQKLIPETLAKARELRALGFKGDIEGDGGISTDNAHMLVEAGFNVLVMGTGYFKAQDPKAVVERVHSL